MRNNVNSERMTAKKYAVQELILANQSMSVGGSQPLRTALMKNLRLHAIALSMLGLLVPVAATAQAYPTKPVRLVYGSAGNGTAGHL